MCKELDRYGPRCNCNSRRLYVKSKLHTCKRKAGVEIDCDAGAEGGGQGNEGELHCADNAVTESMCAVTFV